MLSKKLIEHGYSYESMLSTSVDVLKSSCRPAEMSLTSLMYYGGYATIHKYDEVTNKVILKIPNKSINKYLAKDYLKSLFSISDTTVFERVAKEVRDIMTLTPIDEMDSKIKEISKLFDSLLDDFTYDALTDEQEFRNIIDCIFKIGFRDVAFEVHTKNGRSDTVIIEKSRTFIIEYEVHNENKIKKKGKKEPSIKAPLNEAPLNEAPLNEAPLNEAPNKAPSNKVIEQIKEKEYYAKYSKTNTPILLFGITLKTNKNSTNKYIDIQYDVINNNK